MKNTSNFFLTVKIFLSVLNFKLHSMWAPFIPYLEKNTSHRKLLICISIPYEQIYLMENVHWKYSKENADWKYNKLGLFNSINVLHYSNLAFCRSVLFVDRNQLFSFFWKICLCFRSLCFSLDVNCNCSC